jgi:hypothetical protein
MTQIVTIHKGNWCHGVKMQLGHVRMTGRNMNYIVHSVSTYMGLLIHLPAICVHIAANVTAEEN